MYNPFVILKLLNDVITFYSNFATTVTYMLNTLPFHFIKNNLRLQ